MMVLCSGSKQDVVKASGRGSWVGGRNIQAEGITSHWNGVISTLHLTLDLLAPAKPFSVLPFPSYSKH